MSVVLNMSRQTLELGKSYLNAHRIADGLRTLRKLLELPDLSPNIAAEANYLIAKVHFDRSDFVAAKSKLARSLEIEPTNAESHFLLAQSLEQDQEAEVSESALEHFEEAARLAPADPKKRSAYALQVAVHDDRTRGIAMLEETYREHSSDPVVVENFVEGLIHAELIEDAELVVAQANYRHSGDSRFRSFRARFQQRMREHRLFGKRSSERSDDVWILPFRSFGANEPPKPRGPRRPAQRPDHPAVESSEPAPVGPITLESEMTLASVLKAHGSAFTASLYERLGLLGKRGFAAQRSEIVAAFADKTFLKTVVKDLPPASRKLLRTLVKAGGYIPARLLFQNTGADAPPPDHAQPLLQMGLLFFGKRPEKRKAAAESLVAVVPADLVDRLAAALKRSA